MVVASANGNNKDVVDGRWGGGGTDVPLAAILVLTVDTSRVIRQTLNEPPCSTGSVPMSPTSSTC